jgi:hypothetical protein
MANRHPSPQFQTKSVRQVWTLADRGAGCLLDAQRRIAPLLLAAPRPKVEFSRPSTIRAYIADISQRARIAQMPDLSQLYASPEVSSDLGAECYKVQKLLASLATQGAIHPSFPLDSLEFGLGPSHYLEAAAHEGHAHITRSRSHAASQGAP